MVRSIAGILALADSSKFKVPPSVPYEWRGGAHNIEMIKPNVPIIGMAYVHEGDVPEEVDPGVLEDARVAAEDEAATEKEVQAYTQMMVQDQVHANFEQFSNWYLILVACTQVRELTDSNLQNFSRMCGSAPIPARVKPFLTYWASQQENLAESEEVRERFEDNKFFEYHTTGSSTPALCIQAIDESGDLGLFNDLEIEKIHSADDERFDLEAARLIPSITLVKVSAVLEAAGTLPEVWYMGAKAREKFSGKKYSALVKFIKEIFKRQMSTESIEEIGRAHV